MLVLNLEHTPLYRHFYKCRYIEMLKILLVYLLLDKFSVFDNLKISFHCVHLSKTLAYCQSYLFHDFLLHSECKSPKRFLLASFNLAFISSALRSVALRFLTSAAKLFLRSSTSYNTASNFDKRSNRIFFSSRKSWSTASRARNSKSACSSRSTR